MIVTFNIEPEDLKKLDAMAGPRGRSKWLRRTIAINVLFPALLGWAEEEVQRRAQNRPKKPARRKAA